MFSPEIIIGKVWEKEMEEKINLRGK